MRFVQQLEKRALLSAVLGSDGTLTITGTTGNDSISVGLNREGKLAVAEAVIPPRPEDGTKPERPTPTITTFDAAAVKAIVVNAGDGNDFVGFAGRGKRAVKVGATVDGGAGNDRLVGTRSADSISGNAGNDLIEGLAGNDTLNGNDGNDWLVGGEGDDVIGGGAGNDRILSFDRTGKDTIDGGANDAVGDDNKGDTAVADTTDVVTNVEVVRNRPVRPAGPGRPR